MTWKLTPLKNITTKIGSGATPRGGKNSYKTEGMTLIRSLNVYDFEFSYKGLAFITEKQASETRLARVIVEPKDILLNITGASVARCCIVPEHLLPARVNQHVSLVRVDPNRVHSYYVLYCINNPVYKHQLLTLAQGGATREALTKEIIGNFEIPLPLLPTQRKIAAVLSAYDELILNNTRRIKILEDMAQAIYREWFVHFRFPGHENVKMVESELGLIPEGWEVVSASEAISINPKTSVPRNTRKPFVPMKSATEHSMLITEVEERTGSSGAKFKNGDTLFARITPCLENGRTGFVQFLPSDDVIALGSTEFIVLRSKTLNPYFVYLLAQTHEFRENAIKSMTGTTGRQRVVNQCFDDYFLPNPGQDTLNRFKCIIVPLFRQVQNLWERNANLRQTRDLLLPKLISGEIDVSDLDIVTD